MKHKELPSFVMVRQTFESSEPVQDVHATLRERLDSFDYDYADFAGKTVGITAGSRGITHIDEMIHDLADFVKEKGGTPVIFAAMGSHGGGTAEGQREMLRSLGISEETMGCEVRTSAECQQYGYTASGFPVYGNVLASQFDRIILINRIKMHTDFEADTESGLLKIMSIGIGNPKGCMNVHRLALVHGYGKAIQETALRFLDCLPVAFGVALTENWKHELDRIEVVKPENILERERELLKAVKAQMVRLPVSEADALLIGWIGKDISGTGMDTKVVGRIGVIGQAEPETPKIKRVTVLDITEASHGNAIGIGLADLSTEAVLRKIDVPATALNGISSMSPEQSSLPCFATDDLDAIKASVETVGLEDTTDAKVLYIKDTNSLEYIAVSLPLYEDIKDLPQIEAVSEPFELSFDEEGNLLNKWVDHKTLSNIDL